ncbi:YafY family transcriptional regulator [Mycolicibacillus parakoreensis]|uniref:YafY family transcriptional regulator n=1 Tax=Mycolicibacillus parakoreensis TaxID=1069221 RepID=A0ABY3U9A9_9MYCO|nr:YafY family protein [Mycolicibacillus parakoreensis]MCV7314018.1 YafY family transcriptional regulator [Mycolicibacillus parakoreensis]ULN54536.1 YafY family transcriptional regulator [Mycolicibacillus parakoreensis]
MAGSAERLVRLLNLVPYLQANPRVHRAKAAADLGVSAEQLASDLYLLFVSGRPGYLPDDLIDYVDIDADQLEVTFSAGLDFPLRLTSPEATGLLMALRALTDVPGALDATAARSAIAKIEAAAGAATGAAAGLAAVEEPAPAEGDSAAAVRDAVNTEHALSIDYYAASHDTLSTRVVDPIRVVVIGNHSYLEAWCREADGVRLFRFDRIVDASVLDEPAAPPEPAVQAGTDTSLFTADPGLPAAMLRVAPSAAWMFEYYPMRVTADLPDGSCEAAMTYASEQWMTRLMLGFGAEVTVLAPETLAARVRAAADAALEAYRADG